MMFVLLAVAFSAGLIAGTFLPQAGVRSVDTRQIEQAATQNSGATWSREGNPDVRQPVEVLRTIDGDTFEGRVHLCPGLEMTTRVRLRGIDAPELQARCADELHQAQDASEALRALLN